MSRVKRTVAATPAAPPSAAIELKPESTSFNAFQSAINETVKETARQRHASHQAAAAAAAALAATPEAAQLESSHPIKEDGITLLERLSNPTPDGISTLAALLLRQLDKGELILQLAQHNLNSTSITALFDSDNSPTLQHLHLDSTQQPLVLLPSTIQTLLSTLQQISAEISCVTTLLHSPYSPTTGLLPPPAVPTLSTAPIPADANDDEKTERWRAKSVRFLVRKVPENSEGLSEVRVAVVGNVDAGKSSLLGVLTKGALDDGRGRARISLFRHKHEIETGRTSSVGLELLGFAPTGEEITQEVHFSKSSTAPATAAVIGEDGQEVKSRRQALSWEEISGKAHKIISFTDLAGHERYLKTTLFGLTATLPDFVLLVVGANAGLIGMSKEHLSVALALSIPVVCVVTKIDMTPPNVLEQTLKQLVKVLRSPGCRKQPVFVKDLGQACELAQGFVEEKACPIFLVSNVAGTGLDLLKTFLNVVPTGGGEEGRYPVDGALEFSISDVFAVPFVGSVVSGILLSGSVSVGDVVYLGPDSLGAFTSTAIKSIQRKRVNVAHAEAGQSVSFALKRIKRSAVRKGMVILEKGEVTPKAVRSFEGQVLILYHNTLIVPKYQAMLHVGSVRQTVKLEHIVDKTCIRTGDRATCQFRFISYPEHVKVGDRILFREGKTKGLGVITRLLD